MKWNETTRLLEECEKGLRKLVGEAAAEGDYASVQQIADVAKAVAALAAQGRSTQPAINGNSRPGAADIDSPASPKVAVGRRSHPLADEYPKFFRRGDELVKVGWSKKDRKEYHHSAPRGAIDAAAAAVRQVGAKGKMFNGDALLPLKYTADGSAVPEYQAYIALAWLKKLGVVGQHGRRAGYTLEPDKQIDSIITAAWPELPEWRG